MKTVLCRGRWKIVYFTILLIITYPFLCLGVNELTNFGSRELYTFGLPFEKFMTPWIALWAVIGTSIGVIQMQERMKKMDTQIKLQQKQLRNALFSSGMELLGNDKESTRVGGIFNLYILAKDFPEEYLNPVCEIFCSHIRTITNTEDYRIKYEVTPSEEIQTIITLLFHENDKGKRIFDNRKKNLNRAYLYGISFGMNPTLKNADFCHVKFGLTNFSNATLYNVNFSDANFLSGINFSRAMLNNVNFCFAKFDNVNFSKATLCNTTFFTAKLGAVITIEHDDDPYETRVDIEKSKANFSDTKLTNVTFKNASLFHIDFSGAEIKNTTFNNRLKDCKDVTEKGVSLKLTSDNGENPDFDEDNNPDQ